MAFGIEHHRIIISYDEFRKDVHLVDTTVKGVLFIRATCGTIQHSSPVFDEENGYEETKLIVSINCLREVIL